MTATRDDVLASAHRFRSEGFACATFIGEPSRLWLCDKCGWRMQTCVGQPYTFNRGRVSTKDVPACEREKCT